MFLSFAENEKDRRSKILELTQLLHVPVFQLENSFKMKIVTVAYPGGKFSLFFRRRYRVLELIPRSSGLFHFHPDGFAEQNCI